MHSRADRPPDVAAHDPMRVHDPVSHGTVDSTDEVAIETAFLADSSRSR